MLGLAEQYPDVKASRNFLASQVDLSETENKIAYARQFYNAAVQALDGSVQSIPAKIVAGVRVATFIEAVGDERGPVRVKF